jgi:hypothetical protein
MSQPGTSLLLGGLVELVKKELEGGSLMAEVSTDPVLDILGQISAWPPPLRLSLASKILQSLEREQRPPRKSLADLWGLMATDEVPPTDDEVRQIIEEERLRKYG